MTSFWRFTLFGIFGAAGVGLALCVAISGGTAAATDASAVAESSNTPAATQATADVAVSDATAADAPQSLQLSPVRENVAPVIAQQQSFSAQQQSFAPPQQSFATQQQAYPPPPQSLAAQQQPYAISPTPPGPLLAQAQGPVPGDPSIRSNNPSGPPTNEAELMDTLRQHLQQSMQNAEGANGNAADRNRSAGNLPAGRPEAVNAPPAKPRPRITRIPGDGDNNLSIHIQDADLRDVLGMLSEQGGLNILPSPNVQGKVSASLNGVDIDTALSAILRSTGFIAKRDGKFIYVGNPLDFKTMDQSLDTVGTRIYHLNYVRTGDIQALVMPLLTPGIGSLSTTPPANEGIAADSDKVGGNQFAGGDSVLIRDYVAVLDQIEQVIGEVDRHPAQVQIEAMILRVKLKDEYRFGIDFELLRQNPDVRLATGSPLKSVDDLKFTDGGLKVAFLNGSTNAFIQALETIGDTNIVASPRLMVLDKARAEVLIGKQLGYVNTTITETSTAQNVQFLEVGTQLRLRPFISSDGLVRMEVHPELSEGNVEVRGGFTLPNKETTQVTTNVVVPDGCTVIIGGLIQEGLKTTGAQVPFFGSLPGIGWLFRNRQETNEREEIVVLITPHVVCGPEAACEGDKAAAEFHRRHAVYADSMSPLSKRYIGRKYYRLAQSSWAQGDQPAALRFIDLAIHFDPENRAAINLRTDIWNGNLTGDHTLLKADVLTPGGYVAPGMQPEIEMEMEQRAPGYDLPPQQTVPPPAVIPRGARKPAPSGQMVQVSDTPLQAPPLLPTNLQTTAMPRNDAPRNDPPRATSAQPTIVQVSNEVEVGPRLSGYSAEAMRLPPPPSAAMPTIPTKPLEPKSTTAPAGQTLRANAVASPYANPSVAGSPAANSANANSPTAAAANAPRALPPNGFPNSKSVLLKKPATPQPMPTAAQTGPTLIQPATKTTPAATKAEGPLDNQQLPDFVLDGLMQQRTPPPKALPQSTLIPERLPPGYSRALEPAQKFEPAQK